MVMGARALAPEVCDVSTPGVSTPSRTDGRESPLPLLKVLQHRSAGGQAKLMALHFAPAALTAPSSSSRRRSGRT